MGRKVPYTPVSRITSALRQLWLRSRERASALKREKNTCERCGAKQSVAKGREVKVVVHHRNGIDWSGIAELIRERILVHPDKLEVLCKPCNDKEHPPKRKARTDSNG